MRPTFLLLAAALVLSTTSAPASTIANFEIVTASDLSPIGGTFNDGGAFGGTFSVDLSQLPTVTGVDLPAVDITTTTTTGFTGITYASGSIVAGGTTTVFGIPTEAYVISLFAADNVLSFVFIEPPGTFDGGPIFHVSESNPSSAEVFRQDESGDAIAVDPAFVSTPEPPSFTPCALALLAIYLFRRRDPRLADFRPSAFRLDILELPHWRVGRTKNGPVSAD